MRARILDALESWYGTRPRRARRAPISSSPSRAARPRTGSRCAASARASRAARRAPTTSASPHRRARRARATGEQRHVLCVAPRGMQEGAEIEIAMPEFEVLANAPVRFPIFASSTRTRRRGRCAARRRRDVAGRAAADLDRAALRALARGARDRGASARDPDRDRDPRALVPVARDRPPLAAQLRPARARAAGSTPRRRSQRTWPSDPDDGGQPHRASRRRAGDDRRRGADRGGARAARGAASAHVRAAIRSFSCARSRTRSTPVKDAWPIACVRRLWDALFALEAARERTPEHEARWLNLAGFLLRPGYGEERDAWRVEHLWRRFDAGPRFANAPQAARRVVDDVEARLGRLDAPAAAGAARLHPAGAAAAARAQGEGQVEGRSAGAARDVAGRRLAREAARGRAPGAGAARSRRASSRARRPATPRSGRWVASPRASPLTGPGEQRHRAAHRRAVARGPARHDVGAEGGSSTLAIAQMARVTGDRARDVEPGLRERLAERIAGESRGPASRALAARGGGDRRAGPGAGARRVAAGRPASRGDRRPERHGDRYSRLLPARASSRDRSRG